MFDDYYGYYDLDLYWKDAFETRLADGTSTDCVQSGGGGGGDGMADCTIGINTASPLLIGGKLYASYSKNYAPSKDLISAANIRSLLDFSSDCESQCTLMNTELRTTDNGAVAPSINKVELVNDILNFKDTSVGTHTFFIKFTPGTAS